MTLACVHTDLPGTHAKGLFLEADQIFNALFLFGLPILKYKNSRLGEYPAISTKEKLIELPLKLLSETLMPIKHNSMT